MYIKVFSGRTGSVMLISDPSLNKGYKMNKITTFNETSNLRTTFVSFVGGEICVCNTCVPCIYVHVLFINQHVLASLIFFFCPGVSFVHVFQTEMSCYGDWDTCGKRMLQKKEMWVPRGQARQKEATPHSCSISKSGEIDTKTETFTHHPSAVFVANQ